MIEIAVAPVAELWPRSHTTHSTPEVFLHLELQVGAFTALRRMEFGMNARPLGSRITLTAADTILCCIESAVPNDLECRRGTGDEDAEESTCQIRDFL